MKELLKDFPKDQVDQFVAYVQTLRTAKKKDGTLQNYWATKMTDAQFAQMFQKVASEGLVLDGKHVSIQSTGISYSYVAYKNKMLLVYPESRIDMALVYEGDTFTCERKNGEVVYAHVSANPFSQKDDKIIGAYCVISNKRGEFITTLSKEDLEKHRKVARSDYIWREWTKEMCLKTVIKKACKYHFDDIFTTMEEEDNTQNDLEQPVDIELSWKQEIEGIMSLEDLRAYYLKHKGRGKEFDKLVSYRKAFLTLTQQENENT